MTLQNLCIQIAISKGELSMPVKMRIDSIQEMIERRYADIQENEYFAHTHRILCEYDKADYHQGIADVVQQANDNVQAEIAAAPFGKKLLKLLKF